MLLKDVSPHLFLALLEWSLEYGLFKDFLNGTTLEMNCSDSAHDSALQMQSYGGITSVSTSISRN